MMQEMGYEFKFRGESGTLLKHPALRPPGAKGFFRFHKLGQGYTLDEILDRVLDNYHRQVPFPEAEREKLRKYREQTRPKVKAKGLYALYLWYAYELHVIQKFPASVKRVSFFMREDLTRLDRLDEQTRFLAARKIETIDDLNDFRESTSAQLGALADRRRLSRNELKRTLRAGDSDGAEEVRKRITDISEQMRKLRHELELADEIEIRSRGPQAAMREIEEQNKEREVKTDEQQFGRSGRTGRTDEPGRG